MLFLVDLNSPPKNVERGLDNTRGSECSSVRSVNFTPELPSDPGYPAEIRPRTRVNRRCRLQFRGLWAPHLQWHIYSGHPSVLFRKNVSWEHIQHLDNIL